MYVEVTNGVEVEVEPQYMEDQSRPDAHYFIFAYRVRIRNVSERTAQLVSRHWIITDGRGRIETVHGPGVVGEQPKLYPGEEYEYTSYCPLPTPTGNMRGTYQMLAEDGEKFDVVIPLFFLRAPRTIH